MDDIGAFSVGTIEDVVAVLGSTGQHPYLAAAGLTDDGDARDETVRLTRPLVVEGTEFTAALAALHATDAEASTGCSSRRSRDTTAPGPPTFSRNDSYVYRR